MKIATFVEELDELVERTNGVASYLELIGALETTKQRLINEYFDDDDDDDDDD